MALHVRYINKIQKIITIPSKCISTSFNLYQSETEEFQPLILSKVQAKTNERRQYTPREPIAPRESKYPSEIDWPSMWPTARTFHPAVVPLPLYQGYVDRNKRSPPYKYANAELMKIPNFLHLAPPAVKGHCEALQKFCTPFPEELLDKEKAEQHFPLTAITYSFVHANPTIRDPRSRIVKLKFRLSSLPLDYHAKDKFIRLLGNRYNAKNDMATIITDRCPMRKQNLDFSLYALVALTYESNITEDWESEKTEEDYERYFWVRNDSRKTIIKTIQIMKKNAKDVPANSFLTRLSEECTPDEICQLQEVKEYEDAVSKLYNEKETEESVNEYKEKVLQLLMPSPPNEVSGEIVS